jgi:DNA invertase Pin-like site-specific DNA recombinase
VNGTRVGYARCSTDEQDVDIQIEQLAALGVAPERIYIDRGFSGTRRTNRTGLDQALAALWPGSILTVTKFDHFARDVADAHTILTDLSERGVLFGLGASVYDWKDPPGFVEAAIRQAVAYRRRQGHPLGARAIHHTGRHPQLAKILKQC